MQTQIPELSQTWVNNTLQSIHESGNQKHDMILELIHDSFHATDPITNLGDSIGYIFDEINAEPSDYDFNNRDLLSFILTYIIK